MSLTKEQIEAWRGIVDGFMDPDAKTEFNAVIDLALRGLEAEWRPIETAPPDVEALFLKKNGTVETDVLFADPKTHSYRHVYTHWCPLPTQPKEAKP